jgi:hypothetical protein
MTFPQRSGERGARNHSQCHAEQELQATDAFFPCRNMCRDFVAIPYHPLICKTYLTALAAPMLLTMP